MIREQKATNNIKIPNKNLEILKKEFSHCFNKDGDFDFEKFKSELSQNKINFSKESYGLDWLGKSYARVLATNNSDTLLKEDKEFNSREENINSKNILIKGDNLDVLKHLSNAYYEKIKMIYIDPPYNTGNDGFVYQDDRKFTIDEFSLVAGVDRERAKRVLDFIDSKSNSHSAWLTFIYPRLYIAKQLLRDDGVIFISIDDNEVAQLRLVCDEIFGEENFVESLIWKKRATPPNDKNIGRIHEYILCYSKNILKITLGLLPRDKKSIERYKNPDKDPKGAWVISDLSANGKGGRLSLTTIYPITNPKNGKKYMPSEGRCWLFGKDKMDKYLKEGRIGFRDKTGTPFLKRYLSEVRQGLTLSTILINLGYSSTSVSELDNLFIKKGLFEYAKPTILIKTLINIGVIQNDDLILDFFAGSGTTGDAVMQLNSEDEGERKCILVQINEAIDPKKNKTAYEFIQNELKVENPTIFDITKERLIRASKEIKENNPLNQNLDLGFKIFETMPIWEDYKFEADRLTGQLTFFDESRLTKDDLKALLITWKTYDGIELTKDLIEGDLDGYISYYADKKLYLINTEFKTKNLKTLLEKIDSDKDFNPTSIIAFGYNFDSKSLREIAENIKSYANKKSIDIDFIVRY